MRVKIFSDFIDFHLKKYFKKIKDEIQMCLFFSFHSNINNTKDREQTETNATIFSIKLFMSCFPIKCFVVRM